MDSIVKFLRSNASLVTKKVNKDVNAGYCKYTVEHFDLSKDKKYLIIKYDNDENEDQIEYSLYFPCTFNNYSPAYPGAYGDLGEGYYFDSNEKNSSIGLCGECYGNFEIYEFKENFDHDKFYTFLGDRLIKCKECKLNDNQLCLYKCKNSDFLVCEFYDDCMFSGDLIGTIE